MRSMLFLQSLTGLLVWRIGATSLPGNQQTLISDTIAELTPSESQVHSEAPLPVSIGENEQHVISFDSSGPAPDPEISGFKVERWTFCAEPWLSWIQPIICPDRFDFSKVTAIVSTRTTTMTRSAFPSTVTEKSTALTTKTKIHTSTITESSTALTTKTKSFASTVMQTSIALITKTQSFISTVTERAILESTKTIPITVTILETRTHTEVEQASTPATVTLTRTDTVTDYTALRYTTVHTSLEGTVYDPKNRITVTKCRATSTVTRDRACPPPTVTETPDKFLWLYRSSCNGTTYLSPPLSSLPFLRGISLPCFYWRELGWGGQLFAFLMFWAIVLPIILRFTLPVVLYLLRIWVKWTKPRRNSFSPEPMGWDESDDDDFGDDDDDDDDDGDNGGAGSRAKIAHSPAAPGNYPDESKGSTSTETDAAVGVQGNITSSQRVDSITDRVVPPQHSDSVPTISKSQVAQQPSDTTANESNNNNPVLSKTSEKTEDGVSTALFPPTTETVTRRQSLNTAAPVLPPPVSPKTTSPPMSGRTEPVESHPAHPEMKPKTKFSSIPGFSFTPTTVDTAPRSLSLSAAPTHSLDSSSQSTEPLFDGMAASRAIEARHKSKMEKMARESEEQKQQWEEKRQQRMESERIERETERERKREEQTE